MAGRGKKDFLSQEDIVDWIDNEDLDNDESELDDLNGENDGWLDNNSEREDVPDVPPVGHVIDSDESDDNGNEAKEEEHNEGLGPQRKRRKLLKVRLVCNLDEALNPDNYERYIFIDVTIDFDDDRKIMLTNSYSVMRFQRGKRSILEFLRRKLKKQIR